MRSAFSGDPWFGPRVVAAAVGLYAVVFAVRAAGGGPDEGVAVLYVIPIALLAVAFGRTGGLAGAAAAAALFAVWVVSEDLTLSPLAWSARIVPFLVVGWGLGETSDRLERAQRANAKLRERARRRREAAEIHDTVVQGLAAARWMLEAGQAEQSLEVLSRTTAVAQGLVSELLAGEAVEPGSFRRRIPA